MESLADALSAAGIAFGRLNDVAGLVGSTRSSAGRRVETTAGPVEIVAPPRPPRGGRGPGRRRPGRRGPGRRVRGRLPPPPPRPGLRGAQRGDKGGIWEQRGNGPAELSLITLRIEKHGN